MYPSMQHAVHSVVLAWGQLALFQINCKTCMRFCICEGAFLTGILSSYHVVVVVVGKRVQLYGCNLWCTIWPKSQKMVLNCFLSQREQRCWISTMATLLLGPKPVSLSHTLWFYFFRNCFLQTASHCAVETQTELSKFLCVFGCSSLCLSFLSTNGG